jgi:hypothetical protein
VNKNKHSEYIADRIVAEYSSSSNPHSDLKNLLFTLSGDNDVASNIVTTILYHFNKLPADVQDLIYKFAKIDEVAETDIHNSTLQEKSHSCSSNTKYPIKKCHYFASKYFIVLDESIVHQLKLSNDDNYFSQEVTKEGILLLRPFSIE